MTAVEQHQQQQRPGSSSGGAFGFHKSGLGTPDFFYFGGSSAGTAAGETPSWLKHPKEPKLEDGIAATTVGKGSSSSNNMNVTSLEDGSRQARALSDPPTRQSPAWLQPKNQHEHEPNPFEHSFSGKDYAMMFHPPRRARSQSPKSSHGGANAADFIKGAGSTGFTPGSADLGNFGWALQQSEALRGGGSSTAGGGSGGTGATAVNTRGGPLTPRTAMLNGSSGMTPGFRSGPGADAMMFDPTSIRTGFTPGGLNGPQPGTSTNNYPPHSPATQALFAMMTNATPGLPALPRVESEYSGSDSTNEKPTGNKLQQPAQIQPSRNSSGSGRSPESNSSGHVQAIPRPINPGSIYGNRPNPLAAQQPNSNSSSFTNSYQGSQGLLSQAAPRPLPPHAFSNSTNGGSQNSVPQTRGAANGGAAQPGGQNPLFLLSQQMQQEMPEDDTVLAAAALSGLSTPRGTYVGGPGMPTIAPGTLQNNAGKMNLQQPPRAPQPAGQSKPALAAQPSTISSTASVPKASAAAPAGKKGGPANNKRKKTDDSALGSKKPKRNTRRAAAANAQPIVDADTLSEDEDDDGASIGGSVGRSDNGRNMSYNAGSYGGPQQQQPGQGLNRQNSNEEDGDDKVDAPRKGGRGPKQQFETEEEKRKNFLERNRQAALKCRQRKKQWLGELQQRVENLTQDNEVLQQTCNHLREEVMSLRNILLSHKDCQVASGGPVPGMQGNVTIGGLLSAQMQGNGQMMPQHHMQQQGPPRPY